MNGTLLDQLSRFTAVIGLTAPVLGGVGRRPSLRVVVRVLAFASLPVTVGAAVGQSGTVGTITGTVTLTNDSHEIPGLAEPGEGIPGVTITVENTSLMASTGADGTYTISEVPLDRHTVVASSPIFPNSPRQVLTVSANEMAVVDFAFDAPPLIPLIQRPEAFGATGDIWATNLDAGLLVAGRTRWDHDGDGVIFNETFGGWLWTPTAGMRIFEISDELYFTPSFYDPAAIADNGAVAGTTIFRRSAVVAPWQWTAAAGLEFLPLPDETDWTGLAAGISRDGQVVAGTACRFIFRVRPCGGAAGVESRAVLWDNGTLTELPAVELYAEANGLDASGTVVVGAAGAQPTSMHATRWVDGARQALDAVGTSSKARFSSADGSIAVGTAVLADGTLALVRWGPGGNAKVVGPPAGMSLVDVGGGLSGTFFGLASISADGSTAVGSVADGVGDPQFRNWAPYVWTKREGFVILPEAGLEDVYNWSRAVDASDDGRIIVGVLQKAPRSVGDPPTVAVVWSRANPRDDIQLFTINDLLLHTGMVGDLEFFNVDAISGDGSWILTSGSGHPDTSSVFLRLREPGGPRTPGYWKNWNRCTGGRQADVADANGGPAEGFFLLEDVLPFLWDDILTDSFRFHIDICAIGVDLLDRRDIGDPDEVKDGKKRANDAAYYLASHLLAAQANFAAGTATCTEALDAAADGEELLDEIDFDGTASFLPPRDNNPLRDQAIVLAATLDLYNNNELCSP